MKSVFHHGPCGFTWTLPNDTEAATCPNCDVQANEAAKLVLREAITDVRARMPALPVASWTFTQLGPLYALLEAAEAVLDEE